VGKRGWVLITKDQKIEKRPREKSALLNANVRAFILMHGSLGAETIVELLRQVMNDILNKIELYQPPFIFGITLDGSLVPLSDLSERARD
jgi:hypothetical protein